MACLGPWRSIGSLLALQAGAGLYIQVPSGILTSDLRAWLHNIYEGWIASFSWVETWGHMRSYGRSDSPKCAFNRATPKAIAFSACDSWLEALVQRRHTGIMLPTEIPCGGKKSVWWLPLSLYMADQSSLWAARWKVRRTFNAALLQCSILRIPCASETRPHWILLKKNSAHAKE